MQVDESVEFYVLDLSQICLAAGPFYVPTKHVLSLGEPKSSRARHGIWGSALLICSNPKGDFIYTLTMRWQKK